MNQLALTDMEYSNRKKKTKREEENRTGSVPLKKQIKSDVNRISIAIIVNSLIMVLIVIIGMVVRPIAVALQSGSSDIMKAYDDIIEDNAFWERVAESGVEYLLFSVLGVLAIWLIMRKKAPLAQLFQKRQSMNVHSFFYCFVIFMGIQGPIVLFDTAVEAGLNQFGYTAESGADMAMAGSLTLSMFFYSSLIGPIAEELIYRGFVMRSLEKYGESFAVVVSAVLFGVMHQNLIQSIFAFLVGLI
ncbi:MAG: CPBP family intramembrane metalloprotease, partial [Clostridium sp.]|nr:CPBP family intramembrane metalloprotease [Clostridium sp.]